MPLKTWHTKADFDAAYRGNVEPDGHPHGRDAVTLGYSRTWLYAGVQHKAAGIEAAMGWAAPGPVMVILGAGFGWLAEAFETRGYTSVCAVDTSAYVQAEKGTTELADIEAAITARGLDPNTGEGATIRAAVSGRHGAGTGPRSRAARGVLNSDVTHITPSEARRAQREVRDALGLTGNAAPNLILTDSMLESFTDIEVIDELTRLRAWVPTLVHYVVPLAADPADQDPGYNWKSMADWKLLVPTDTFIEAGTYRVV